MRPTPWAAQRRPDTAIGLKCLTPVLLGRQETLTPPHTPNPTHNPSCPHQPQLLPPPSPHPHISVHTHLPRAQCWALRALRARRVSPATPGPLSVWFLMSVGWV